MFKKASIIIASKNEGAMLTQTVLSLRRAPVSIPYEIIAVDDGSTDDSFAVLQATFGDELTYIKSTARGHGSARNLGALAASGDMLVFCDAHIDVQADWLGEFAAVMDDYGADAVTPAFCALSGDDPPDSAMLGTGEKGCGMTLARLTEPVWNYTFGQTPFETPILCGACWAVRGDAFRQAGGYEEALRGYGGDDAEMSLKLWFSGFKIFATPRTCVEHHFRRIAPYTIYWNDLMYNNMYIALCHYNDTRVARMTQMQELYMGAQAAYDEVFTPENIRQVRLPKFAKRVRDDDWFFSYFGLSL